MLNGDRKAIVQFKRECRNYFYYVADVKNTLLDIKALDHKMQGVHSLDFERVKSSAGRKSWKKSKIVTYIEANNELKRRLKEKEKKIQYVLDTINRMDQPSYRGIIWKLYVQRKRINDVAEAYGMSRDYLSQQISEEMARLFPAPVENPEKK